MKKGLIIALVAGGLLLIAGSAGAAVLPTSRRSRVVNREAADGVHPDVQWFLDQWEISGPFDVQIGQLAGFPGGGLRTAADAAGQVAAAAAGLSNAASLKDTPHGRGGAVDLWPVGFNPYVAWAAQPPEMKAAFQAIGDFAKSLGFVWGGDWRSATFPDGDQPHVEMSNWRSLPYPPPAYPSAMSGFAFMPSRRLHYVG